MEAQIYTQAMTTAEDGGKTWQPGPRIEATRVK
jgi:hypothetical protein